LKRDELADGAGACAIGASIGIDTAPDAISVRRELARILGSKCFATSERMRALLEYLVNQTLDGRADRLKEYTIAIEVFGRGDDFDPRIETLVRTEAWRLRARLAFYYETEGVSNAVRLELVKRSFAVHARSLPIQSKALCFEPRSLSPVARIAVLPFFSGSDDALLRVLGESLADEFSHALCRLPRLEVAARSSCHSITAKATMDVREAARNLGVTLLFEGNLRRTGTTIRLMLQLIDVKSGCQVWTHAKELTPCEDAGFLEDTAVRLVTEMMRSAPVWQTPLAETFVESVRLDPDLRQILHGGMGGAPVVLDTLRHSIAWLEARLRENPNDADMHLSLANLLATFITIVPCSGADLMPRLRESARMTATQPHTATHGLVAWGMASLFVLDLATAHTALARAVERSPQDCGSRVAHGLLHMQVGRLDAAMNDIRLAREFHPLSATVTGSAAAALINGRRYSEAVELARRAVALDTEFKPAQALLADAMFWDGRVSQALGRFEELTQDGGRTAYMLGKLGYVSARAGLTGKARALLEELDHSDDDPARVSMARVPIQLGLGDHEAAFAALTVALQTPTAPELLLCSAPQFDPIRGDKRFAALLVRLSAGAGAGAGAGASQAKAHPVPPTPVEGLR